MTGTICKPYRIRHLVPICLGFLIASALFAASGGGVLAAGTRVIGNVPLVRQDYALSCEAAALQMALAHEGIRVSQTQELGEMGIDRAHPGAGYTGGGDPYANFVGDPNGSEALRTGYGTYWSTVSRVAQRHGAAVARAGEGVGAAEVYSQLLAGHPVVTWVAIDWGWHPPSSYVAWNGRRVPYAGPVEHSVTAIGVSDTAVLINDPYRVSQYWESKAVFERAYAVYGGMAVAVV